jgi:hypothetical protein
MPGLFPLRPSEKVPKKSGNLRKEQISKKLATNKFLFKTNKKGKKKWQ